MSITDNLKKIDDVNQFTDEAGLTICDFYNANGGLLLLKGHLLTTKIYSLSPYAESQYFSQKSTNSSQTTKLKTNGEVITPTSELSQVEKNRKILEDRYGKKTIQIFSESIQEIEEIFVLSVNPVVGVKKAFDVIDQTAKEDKDAIISCIFNLRETDTYTYAHSLSVYALMMKSLEKFNTLQTKNIFWETFKQKHTNINFTKTSLRQYGVGALLHDYGKKYIPKEILNKPGKLTDKEFAIIKLHPLKGVMALEGTGIDDAQILSIVGNHHAQYRSYLKLTDNPLATSCNIIDMYDALRSRRIYKDSLSLQKTLVILRMEQAICKWNPFLFNVVVNDVLLEVNDYRIDDA